MAHYSIEVRAERFKFSAAHLGISPEGHRERLHGHNFRLQVRMRLASSVGAGAGQSSGPVGQPRGPELLAAVKRALRDICRDLHERTLVALSNPHLRVTLESTGEREQVRLSHPQGEYLLPREDVVLLPMENTSADQLAAWIHGELCRRLRALPAGLASVDSVEVGVLAGLGEGGLYEAPAVYPQ